MGTADRSAPLRRTGSLLGLVGLELAALLAMHWLGRFPGLRVRWAEPVPWLASSPVQEVLGAVLRMVGLVMAYWLLASTLLYLLASLTRLPAAVRAVSWATIPVVRRVADHAVAVTLATSMVGGGTLGVAGPAMAAPNRGGMGPPARTPVAAAQATSSTAAPDAPSTSAPERSQPAYVPDPADQVPAPDEEATEPSQPGYVPDPADQAPTRLPPPETPATETPATETPATETAATDSGATARSGSGSSATSSTAPTTTAPTTTAPTTTAPTTTAPTTAAPTITTPSGAAPQASPGQAREGDAVSTTATTGLRKPGYVPTPATSTTNPPAEVQPDEPGTGSGETAPEADQEKTISVVKGDNLWTIARDRLATAPGAGSREPTDREVADYWAQVKEVNRDELPSGDPDLIAPGDKIVLPPVPSAPAGPAPEAGQETHSVVEGDNLWTIARDRLATAPGAGSGEPTDREVADYLEQVEQVNRDELPSGDPDLIVPGDKIVLPPVD
jgi:hypothetical protein